MVSIQEMSTWSADDARAAVYDKLPKGWTFEVEGSNALWYGSLSDSEGLTKWSSSPSADIRVVCIDAYVWLHLGESKPTDPRWTRREDSPLMGVSGGHQVPDPDDLNPEEVLKLYRPKG